MDASKRRRRRKPAARDPVWFMLMDERRCRLLQVTSTRLGTPRVKEASGLENTAPRPKLGRPQALAGMTGHSYASPHHRQFEQLRRFVKEVLEWLQHKHDDKAFSRITVFSTPRVLGELRQALTGALLPVLELHEGNLVRLRLEELAEHATIAALVNPCLTGKSAARGPSGGRA